MPSIFLRTQARDISNIELPQPEDEGLRAHNGEQQVSSLYHKFRPVELVLLSFALWATMTNAQLALYPR
jgi:hypothetical protein